MKKLLALVLAMVMTLGLATVSSSAAYSDEADVSLNEAVDVMSAVGVFQGADGKFSPKANLNREQAAKLIAYLDLGEDTAEALPAVKVFSDVPVTSWSAKYIAYCADAGYIVGDGTGKFNPAGELTGYAFGKMVLCVLGYDSNIEGFTGNNWSIAVAKLMESNDIAKGVKTGASATLTREQAAQYCLNALKADMVEYDTKGTSIDINGAKIATGASKAESVVDKTCVDKHNVIGIENEGDGDDTVTTVQLGEKLYDGDLELNDDATSDFGAPCDTWKYDGKEVGQYASKAVATFTVHTKAADVASALNGYTVKVGGKDLKVNNSNVVAAEESDGKILTFNAAEADELPIGGQTLAAAISEWTAHGKLTEVYANSSKKITDIVVVPYVLAKVTDVTTVKNKTTYSFTADSMDLNIPNGVIYNDDSADDTVKLMGNVAKGDYVTIAMPNGAPLYVYPTTSITGAQSSLNTDVVATISGTKYDVAYGLVNFMRDTDDAMKAAVIAAFPNSSDDAVYYIDQYGCIVKTTSVAASTAYAYVISVNGKTSTTIDGTTPSVEARVMLADGTVGVYSVELKKVKSSDIPAGGTWASNVDGVNLEAGDYVIKGTNIIVYNKNADGGTLAATAGNKAVTDLAEAAKDMVFGYTLSDKTIKFEPLTALPANETNTANDTTYSAALTTVTKDTTKYTVNTDKKVLADKNTKFVVYNADKKTATVYTGAANLPKATEDPGVAVLKTGTTSNLGTASVVFIKTAEGLTADATKDYVYIDVTKYDRTIVDGENKFVYTGTKADGSEFISAPGDKLETSGLYTYNEDNELDDELLAGDQYKNVEKALTVSGDLLGYDGNYYNITDSTKIVYVDEDLSKVDGNKGFVVLTVKDGDATSNVEAIFVTSEG
jgi:hypothetical protein